MADKLAPGLFRIEVPLPGSPLRNLNSYLIMSEGRGLLVDTGWNSPGCREALLSQLEELGADMEATDIFLTHMHTDHSGLAPDIAAPGARIYIGERDKAAIDGQLDGSLWDDTEELFVRHGFFREDLPELRKGNPAVIYAPSRKWDYVPLRDGDCVRVGKKVLRCIDTPGHTPGHACLYLEDDGILLTGDHVLFEITPNISIWTEMRNPLARYLESLDKLASLPVKAAFAAHRRAAGSLKERIGELRRHHEERLEEAYRIVLGNPGAGSRLVASRMSWSIRAEGFEDFPLTQKWFALGEAGAHLELLEASGRIKREMDNGLYRYEAV